MPAWCENSLHSWFFKAASLWMSKAAFLKEGESQHQYHRAGTSHSCFDDYVSVVPEHAVKNRINMLQMIAKIEFFFNFCRRQGCCHFIVGLEQFKQG